MKLHTLSVSAIAASIKKGEITAEAVMTAHLDRISKYDGNINAFITVSEKAIEEAREVDSARKSGKTLGRLAGVPVAVKDMLCTEGIKTTAASKILANFIPPYSATVVERLKKEGAIVIGKANCDEFAMGSSNETSAFGNVKNPWNTKYVPGGSSGGSAAAVSGQMAAAAIGTDTGGSIRQPANFCGIVGIKPTYGRVSRFGIVAFASSLDQAGPMAKNVKDCALVLESISGFDEKDSTSAQNQVPNWSEKTSSNVKGLKIGLPKEYFSGKMDADVKARVEETIAKLKSAGAIIVDIELPSTPHCIGVYYLVCASEASSNLARYDGIRYGYRYGEGSERLSLEELYSETRGRGFGSEVKRRIMIGTYALSSGYYDAYYLKACQVRRMIREEFSEAFSKCDVILSPVTTSPAFKIGERIEDPLTMYLNDIFTTSANLAGVPGMSVPVGFSKEGLPIGVQLMGRHFDEQTLFNVGQCIEENVKTSRELPDVIQ
ncbi:MAG: Asp-tRNA(Asn)/Glu-tRNA(Gln) amidotransferase subunit GatA [Pseudomonadota bacterium]|nr:Asp-tRNA(Asn)/Glu-tRNA(Gln) amidotransferase subunit GatA [Pseudomonadota bacterium]